MRGTPKIKAPSSFEFILDELAGLDLLSGGGWQDLRT
jgi:hypothetical protein